MTTAIHHITKFTILLLELTQGISRTIRGVLLDKRHLLAADDIAGTEHIGQIHAAKEGTHIIVGRLAQDLVGCPDLDHLTVLHDGDAITDTHRFIQIVGDKDDGALMAGLQLEQFILHLGADQRIQRGESLIHQQYVGVIGQCAGQTDPLLHATGEGIGEGVHPLAQTHLIECLAGTFLAFEKRYTGQFQTKGGIFQHAQMRHEGKRLEHHADLLAPYLTQLAVRNGGDVLTVDQHLTTGRLDKTVEETHQGRFARTGQAHYHKDFSLVDGEIHPMHTQGLTRLFQNAGAVVPFLQQFEDFLRLFSEDFIE